MQHILLLTDFSTNADNAIDYTMQLFDGEMCSFYILNVQKISKYITSDLISSPYKTVHDAIIKNPKKSLDLLIESLEKKYTNQEYLFEGICDYDNFISSVKQVIAIKNIDLIVMGTNGISNVKEAIFGSNTIQVLKTIDLPILVVPENYNYKNPDKILFINETNNTIDRKIIRPLNFFVSKFDSKLDVLSTSETYKKVNNLFKEIKSNYFELGNKPIENEIENFVAKNEIELVVKIVNTKSFFERIFSSSSTAKIAYLSKVPLLFL